MYIFSYKLAIRDCTSSLKLDNTYVKSYQRRSAAYIALKMYDEAIKDLNKILKLEPSNKQAKHDLEVVNNKIKQVGKTLNVNVFCNNYFYFIRIQYKRMIILNYPKKQIRLITYKILDQIY